MTERIIFIMAGGTGGHVFPALAFADQLKLKQYRIIWLGSEQGMEAKLVPQRNYQLEKVAVQGMRGNGLMRYLRAPWMMLMACKAALALYRQYQPVLTVGFGGFASFPGGVAAKWYGCPLIIHEQNAVAGLTNRLLALWAKQVFTGFPGAFEQPSNNLLAHLLPRPNSSTWIGNPVRTSIASLTDPLKRYQARHGKLVLLVLGGSQGARALNRVIPEAISKLPVDERPMVIHQGGAKLFEELQQCYSFYQVQAQLVSFIDDMAEVYQQADLVICRSGALTVSEVACAGVASLFVPFPSAVDDHQTINAQFLEGKQASYLIQQKNLTVEGLVKFLKHLNRQDLSLMAKRAYQLAKRQATDELCQAAEEMIYAS
ncbi:MAG: undecaprenyldiphospho-muramoylpentapeptide beta-N-acetylglucosaminyltransferase [Ferrovum sp. 37-45-19]|uniref:undecaprenyldiphospho-muramoylpentapeptide beta-N-acetylglucosaminyltransferase n=1 Tax=Ferrovum sp. JA12 TaxID=1356299 RepID=UPI0007039AB3|nr:undecaprenyldiphospho-muramoylpentapeptide beta-N-acetylglucosaminyltransferase [Ferrovum sp. JA12]OYV80648.1 MAG: undecaprenyldiphospho-muramoylpentapeptide beta-N-acetylglucosaminyltransferase [Ferrovum sp. 21-44-67]OYV95199.1 MAG: undecaprenyldiphospho-muramoylpentapeptide beta-N-acetylglucosaminyltransferase [Ferrovum sp. 37-45-19]HQT80700.1 undecaprenyldiphospho-muramoylpentapeptide beta-N-acetylglucosaminyltransferase [Ferrovaceae bacterium]KRH79793.1 UDP-N-acetylglucosamine--N-acetylm